MPRTTVFYTWYWLRVGPRRDYNIIIIITTYRYYYYY